MGKGDNPRPCLTGREENDLRWLYMHGFITLEQFNTAYAELLEEGKITRSGRAVK